MSIYEKLNTAMDNNDVNAYAELLHDDFKFVRHATNTEMTKSDWVNVISGMMESGKVTRTNSRCIYENDDILISHSFVSFPDEQVKPSWCALLLAMEKLFEAKPALPQ